MYRFVLTLFLFFATLPLFAITEVRSMEEVLPILESADETTLAVFDVDGVLIQPAEIAFQVPTWIDHKPRIQEMIGDFTPEEKNFFLLLMITRCDSTIIEESIYTVYNTLREKQIPTIALTSCATGPFAEFPCLEEWRLEHLSKHGLALTDLTPISEEIVFSDLPSHRGSYPLHKDGVVFTNDNGICPTKGETLIAYLEESGQTPQQVIFIDDRRSNVEVVEAAVKAYDPTIEFVGLHYTGAWYYPTQEIPVEDLEWKWGLVLILMKHYNYGH